MSGGYTILKNNSFQNVLFNNTQTFNAGAGGVVTNLLTYNIPANTFTKAGKSLQGRISGFLSNNAGTDYSLYCYLNVGGANDITPTIPIPSNANQRIYIIDFTLTRLDATTLQIISTTGISNIVTNLLLFEYYSLNGLNYDFSLSFPIKFDVTNAAVGTVNNVIDKQYANFDLQG